MSNGENCYSYYLEKFHEAKNNWIHTNNTNNLNKYLIEEENKLKNKINNKNYNNKNNKNNTDTDSYYSNNTYYNTYYYDNKRGNKYYNILKYWCCLYRK
tara:strand:- start:1291 stop:1587 length:297 start_codon:yes stop_codon:yes gene_type:complete